MLIISKREKMEKRREEKRREEKITQTCFIEFFLCHYLKITTRTSCSSLFPLYERDNIKIGAAKYERRKHEMKEKIDDCVMIP